MKKLLSLALAGICALAFASIADAGTAIRMKAPTVKQGTSKVTSSSSVNLYQVTTHWSQYAQDYASAAGGKYVVNSIWSNNLLNSQTVYDDLKTVLTGTYKSMLPAVAKETTTVHIARITTGKGTTNYDPANSNFGSISGIANNVIPGRVASLSSYTANNVNTGALIEAGSSKTYTPAEAEAYLKKFKEAFLKDEANNKAKFEAKEAQNAQAVVNKIAALEADYNDFLAAQATALQNAQNDAYAKAQVLAEAQTAYESADAAKDTASKTYKSKENISNLQSAYEDAQTVTASALADYNAKQGILGAAQAEYRAAKSAKNTAEANYAVAKAAIQPTFVENEVEDVDEDGVVIGSHVERVEVPASEEAIAAFDEADAALTLAIENLASADAAVSAAQANVTAAEKVYNRAVNAENAAKSAYDTASNAKESAYKAYKKAVAAANAAKDARDTAKANSDAAAAALAQLKVDQANAKVNKLNALKASLTAFINGLKDVNGNAYSTANIPGYDDVIFDQIAYVAKAYVGAAYVEPQLNIVTSGATSSNSFTSATSVTYTAPQYQMIDGVLTLVSTANTNLNKTTVYCTQADKTVSPLVLDIAGNGNLQASNGQHMPGHEFVKTNNIVADFFGDGFELAMEWVGPQDGLLVAPKADGSVDMSCLFGTAGGYENGYENLSLFDKNDDMKVTGDELNGLSVWQDANGNGIAEAGEVKTVQSLGITSINLDFNKDNFMSSFERNGQTYKMWDWWPNATELITIAAAE